ncbi:hypothetical protein J0J21_23165, partial [Vibrio vulnificus]|uniref:hypothetical protein n=1 Tax=Vibrio vulnificus TaxID=672 RepID=UPI0019D42390
AYIYKDKLMLDSDVVRAILVCYIEKVSSRLSRISSIRNYKKKDNNDEKNKHLKIECFVG